MKLLLALIAVFSVSNTLFSQYVNRDLDEVIATFSNERLLVESSRLIEEGYYASAEKMMDKLLTDQPENCNYNYRKGFLVAEGRGDYKNSIPYLEKAIVRINKNYDMYSGKESEASVDAFFHLAKSYHKTGDLDKAETNYQAFLDRAGKKSDMTQAAELGLQQLKNAKKAMEFPKRNVNVVNLGSVINTSYPEYSPVVSFDGSALYFTSRRQWSGDQNAEFKDNRYDLFPEDIYVAYRDFDDSWIPPTRLEFCKPDRNEASISVSQDERRIYVYQDFVGNGDIFFSDFSTNRFKNIQSLNNKSVNSDYWETHCTVTPDGRTMYFTSDRPGGFGGRDIYRIVKLPDGSWSEPFNLGPTINTPFDEESPFMASDNRTLYFSSNGPQSMGGFDILISVIDQDNNWSVPINLGYPLNSTSDDLFYTETLDGRRGYITSTRGDSYGEKDIYEVQNDYMNVNRGAVLKGKIITLNDRTLPEDITISLACTDCGDQPERTVYPRSRDGIFMMNLEPCHAYEVIFRYDDGATEFYRETLQTDCFREKDEIYREVYLDAEKMAIVEPPKADTVPAEPADTIIPVIARFPELAFKHHFGYNKNKLTTSGGPLRVFLNEVDSQLQSGRQQVTIEIYSSASFVPTKTFRDNQELSETRAGNMAASLRTHFDKSPFKDRVKISVVSALVSGPAYDSDAKNKDKYMPYQFVELKTR